jgi:hypothetical protein
LPNYYNLNLGRIELAQPFRNAGFDAPSRQLDDCSSVDETDIADCLRESVPANVSQAMTPTEPEQSLNFWFQRKTRARCTTTRWFKACAQTVTSKRQPRRRRR